MELIFTAVVISHRPVISGLVPASVPFETYHLHLMRGDKEKKDYIINYGFTSYDLVCLVVCSILGVWYLLKKVGYVHSLSLSLSLSILSLSVLFIRALVW